MITLNWENKSNAKLLASQKYKKSIKKHNQNLLVNGDNLEVLKALKKEYTNAIDIIYIDPPYHTQNHKFIYDDRFKNSASWLDFIYPRLILACGNLKEDGVVFISIDENEVAHLRVLCEEIFTAENFVTQFVWQKKNKASYLHKKVAKVTEYILCFAKDIKKLPMLTLGTTNADKKYPLNFKNNPEKVLHFKAKSVAFKLKDSTVKASDMSSKSIKCELLDDVLIQENTNQNSFRMKSSWRYSQEYLDELLADGGSLSVSKKPFRINLIKNQSKSKMMSNLLSKDYSHMPTYEDATKDLSELFGFEVFNQAKPVALLKALMNSTAKKDALVLDIFGGSGTTAQAIKELNDEDSGERKFIIVQNEEKTNKNSEAFKRGYANIFEITKTRIKKLHLAYKELKF